MKINQDKYLEHVGVLGMHWGRRKGGADRERIKSVKGKPIIVKGNNRFNRSINKNPSKEELKRVHEKNNPISTKVRKMSATIKKKWNSQTPEEKKEAKNAVALILVGIGLNVVGKAVTRSLAEKHAEQMFITAFTNANNGLKIRPKGVLGG